MTRDLRPLLPFCLALAACAVVEGGEEEFRPGDAPPATISPAAFARRMIDTRDVRDHVGYLASDAMRGRGTPSAELDRAAAWITERFAAAGLDPAGQHGGYAHFWPYAAYRAAGGGETGVVQVPNVVGVLAGTDAARAGEYVILHAHFDHLGVGEPDEDGDSIYNGADDNASGVAALLEIAEAFGALPGRPARPVLFLATSGHERGLLGASSFADAPTVFLAQAVAVLNLDRIGHNSPDSVGIAGYRYSTLGPLLARIAAEQDHVRLVVAPDPTPAPGDGFDRGDQYPLARRGIPAVVVTGGPHEDHGRPADEPSRVDHDKVARVARLVFLAARALATGEDVAWTAEGERMVRR